MAHVSLHTLTFLLIAVSSAVASAGGNLRLAAEARFPAAQAETLIRQLNLLPKDPVIQPDGADAPRIVETRFGFPNLAASSGVSADDLGHHAGYYRLPNSYGALDDTVS